MIRILLVSLYLFSWSARADLDPVISNAANFSEFKAGEALALDRLVAPFAAAKAFLAFQGTENESFDNYESSVMDSLVAKCRSATKVLIAEGTPSTGTLNFNYVLDMSISDGSQDNNQGQQSMHNDRRLHDRDRLNVSFEAFVSDCVATCSAGRVIEFGGVRQVSGKSCDAYPVAKRKGDYTIKKANF
jgi:hypothetical protein